MKKKAVKKPEIKTTNLRELVQASDNGKVLVKLCPKTGEATLKKSKKGATHIIEERTGGGALASPIKKWPKHSEKVEAAYGPARLSDELPDSIHKPAWHPVIPLGATWFEYTSGNTVICEAMKFLGEYEGRRGTIRFGSLLYGHEFVSMMPEDKGEAKYNPDVSVIRRKETKIKVPTSKGEPATNSAPKAPKQPATPRASDIPGLIQNGVRKPGAGGKTALVWGVCEELLAKLGRTPTKAEVLAVAVDERGANPGMAGTQHSYWRRFYGHAK